MKEPLSGLEVLCRLACALVLLTVIGCDPSSAKKFDLGRPLPDVRFEVSLPDPYPREVLYTRIERLAYQEGFSQILGDHESAQRQMGKPGFTWRQVGEPETYAEVAFEMSIDENNQSSTFRVVLYNNGLSPLDVGDWVKFGEWRDKLLPEAFPDSKVTVLIDPKPNTDPEQLEQIMAESGVALDPH
jgi:hypothetical protein